MAGERRRRPADREKLVRERYIEGNTVRERRYKEEEYVRVGTKKEKKAYHIKKNWQKASFMTPQYVLILAMASILAVLVSAKYLEARNAINSSVKTITTLESELEKLNKENRGLKRSIDNYTDLNYIYEVATQELGMVPASKDQVIHFDRTESEYVRQNEDIPTH